MNKKIVSILLLVCMLLGVMSMAGCKASQSGKGEKPAFNVPEEGYDGSAVTITFWHTMGAKLQGVLDNYIAEFNKLYPNITIEHSTMGDYNGLRDQIKTALTAGNQPNLAYCYPDHVALYNVAM